MSNFDAAFSIPFHTFDDNLTHSLTFAELRHKKEAKYLKSFLYRINRYVRNLKTQNPNITKSEVEEIFAKDLEEISATSYSGVKISQSFMQYICYDLFAKQPQRLEHYNSLLDSLDCPLDKLEELPRSNFSLTQIYYAAQLKREFLNSDFSDINEFLKYRLDQIIPKLKTDISSSTYLILQQLDKLGLLYSYLDINDKKMNFLGFKEYADALVSDNPSNKAEKLLSIFADTEKMQNQSPFNLLTLYSFWINRFYKELDTYLGAMFVIRDFGLTQSMVDGTFKSPSKEDLDKELVKINLFYDPLRFRFEMQKAEKLKINNESEYDISENIYSFPNDTFLHYVQSEYKDKYKDFFDTYLPNSKNDLTADATHYFALYSPIFAACGLKDATMLYLLICLKENSHYLNAGIIPNNIDVCTNRGFLGKFVGLGIDNGMTDTFLLHIRKSTLMEFLENYMVDDFQISPSIMYDLPLYQGRTDYTNGLYSVPVLAPITDEQKELIRNSVFNSNFLPSTPANRKKQTFARHLFDVMNYEKNNTLIPKSISLIDGTIRVSKQNVPVER